MREIEKWKQNADSVENFRRHGLTEGASEVTWGNQGLCARVDIQNILLYYPKMSREDQIRANKTILELCETYGIDLF